MSCFSGCLMSSASIQKLFCGIYSAFKCSFDESVGEKVVSLSYSSAIFQTWVKIVRVFYIDLLFFLVAILKVEFFLKFLKIALFSH